MDKEESAMKYLHKPKTAAWVLFIISVVVCLLCNFVFLLEDKSAAFNDVNNLLFFICYYL